MQVIPPGLLERLERGVNRQRLLETATALVAVPSRTGEAGAALDRLAELLAADGFAVERPAGGHPAAPAVAVRLNSGRPGRTLGSHSAPSPRRIHCAPVHPRPGGLRMATDKPRSLLRLEYEEAAEAYLRSLPPEHFMEATPQATQCKITLESLDLVHARRPDFQLFNELLIQYPHGRGRRIRQVVPDNMVVVHPEPIRAYGSYDLPLQPVGPFWVLEYVSKGSERKDYEDSFRKYERELKVPYYLLFYPDNQELTLFRHRGGKYATVRANAAGRYPIPQLDIEVALLDGWARYWYKGELLPLPADLQRDLDETRRQLRQAQEEARQAQEREQRLRAQLRALGVEPAE